MADTNSSLRRDAREIFFAGVEAADPGAALRRHLVLTEGSLRVGDGRLDLGGFGAIRVIGMGKASAAMAEALEEILGDRIHGGLVNVKRGHGRPLQRIRVNEAGHPVPDEAGLMGTREMMRLVEDLDEDDLVFCLISGGGSALSPSPSPGLSLAHEQETTLRLLECGATIHEINAIRKHLSRIKGGRLAQVVHPATLVTLVLSDVVGDDLDVIASGPTVPDPSTFSDCLAILNRCGIRDSVPPAVLRYLEKGDRGEVPETPKGDHPAFLNTTTLVVGSNAVALEAAREEAVSRGYQALILSSSMQGETREVASVHAAMAREIRGRGHPFPPPACLISGGETTVTLTGSGKGGRNQEFALAAALDIQGLDRVVILSGGTDGTDGPTDAAGAVVDGDTVARAEGMGMDARDHLARNDSYPFFQGLGDLLMTGPTLTNVMDLRVVLVGS